VLIQESLPVYVASIDSNTIRRKHSSEDEITVTFRCDTIAYRLEGITQVANCVHDDYSLLAHTIELHMRDHSFRNQRSTIIIPDSVKLTGEVTELTVFHASDGLTGQLESVKAPIVIVDSATSHTFGNAEAIKVSHASESDHDDYS
jgi:hypothetical protein